MDAIFLPQLTKAPQCTEEIQVDEFLPELETLTPVRGVVRLQHHGNYLEVSGKAESIITCSCNRCLQQYNQRLAIKTKEIIWFDTNSDPVEDLPLEREVAMEDLVETIAPDGYFDPGEWLYEQMCLAIPQRQLCNSNCPGIIATVVNESSVDRRWSALEKLKNQLS